MKIDTMSRDKGIKTFSVTVRIHNNLLLQRRQELGLNQYELADRASVSRQTYMDLEGLKD